MNASDRLEREQQFHDLQAIERQATFARDPSRLLLSDGDYLNHESWIRPAFEKLGELKNKHVLDYGCGHGMAAVVFARRGAVVTATDLSAGYVAEAEQRAWANDVAVNCVQANAEDLPFPDHSFDAIWGHAILHHLDIAQASHEIHRVLKPGGIAVFCEPWGENPLLRWARRTLPYSGKGHTYDEEPLRSVHLEPLREVFSSVEIEGHQLLAMVRRAWPGPKWLLESLDSRLLRAVPTLKRYCRYVVISVRS